MNALTTPIPSPPQPQHNGDPDPRSFDHELFAVRVPDVDRLIDAKARFVVESARLHAFADSSSEQSERCLCLIEVLQENIRWLQEQIDRELKGLRYSLGKAPAPSRVLDELPG